MIEKFGTVTIRGERPEDVEVTGFRFSEVDDIDQASMEALVWAASVIQTALRQLGA